MRKKCNALKVTLLFPLFDNEGNFFEEEIWGWWRDEMSKILTAFTDMGIVTGWWLGQSDRNRWIVTVVKAQKEVDRIRDFLRLAREKFKQEAMYLDYHPVHFEEVKS